MSIEGMENEEYLRDKIENIRLWCEKLIDEAKEQVSAYQDEANEALRQIEYHNTKIEAYNKILEKVVK